MRFVTVKRYQQG